MDDTTFGITFHYAHITLLVVTRGCILGVRENRFIILIWGFEMHEKMTHFIL